MRKFPAVWLCQVFLIGVLLAACSRETEPTITSKHSIDVIVEGARAIAGSKILPAGYCVDTRLDPEKTIIGGPKDAAGWASETAEGLKYRLLESPKLGTLPASAIALLPNRSMRADCRHRLVLHETQFIEIRQHGERFIYAMLAVDDRCPICGAGYSIGLRLQGERWKVDAPGLARSWVS